MSGRESNGAVGAAVDVLVVGAGPYGLSMYAHLQHRGLRVRILGETMHTWRAHMPAQMFLKSVAAASNLSAPASGNGLADYCAAAGVTAPTGDEPVPIGLFVDYGDWFAERCAPAVEPVRVQRIERHPGGFSVETSAGERFGAASVVVASGLMEHAYVPAELGALSHPGCVLSGGTVSMPSDSSSTAASEPADPAQGLLSHTSQHTDFSAFADRDVAVVGAGQSALESAALLAESGARPIVLARRSPVVFGELPPSELNGAAPPPRRRLLPSPNSLLGPGWALYACTRGSAGFRYLPDRVRLNLVAKILGPFGAWWLRERVLGIVPILEGHRLLGASADGDRVALRVLGPDGKDRTVPTDHVLSATGYRIGADAFGFLSSDLRAAVTRLNGWPRLRADFESSVPGLYFVGFPAAASFGPLMRFVCGTEFAAPRVAAGLLARTAHRSSHRVR